MDVKSAFLDGSVKEEIHMGGVTTRKCKIQFATFQQYCTGHTYVGSLDLSFLPHDWEILTSFEACLNVEVTHLEAVLHMW
jgi:hypothetical protein